MIRARNLTKVYFDGIRRLKVLKGVDLEVGRGEFLSIVGPSGAGKSTLLHILGGLDTPSGGEVIFDGMDLAGLSDPQKSAVRNSRFGFVFQFYHLLREFTALENVMMPALLKKGSMNQQRVCERASELLRSLGLGERLTHRPNQLSGGEQQRVAIARALINDPEILFCDEPTGNLDSETGAQITRLLTKLARDRKMTVVVVTHSLELAKGSDRTLKIFDGKITTQ